MVETLARALRISVQCICMHVGIGEQLRCRGFLPDRAAAHGRFGVPAVTSSTYCTVCEDSVSSSLTSHPSSKGNTPTRLQGLDLEELAPEPACDRIPPTCTTCRGQPREAWL